MSTSPRDHYVAGERPDWALPGQAFHPLTEREPMAERWEFTESDMRASYGLGLRAGVIAATAAITLLIVAVELLVRVLP